MAEKEPDVELAPDYEPQLASTNEDTVVVGPRRMELREDPRFARKVSFWHQFKALVSSDLLFRAQSSAHFLSSAF